MAAQRTKVDLSDDPMMALFDTEDVAPSKSAAAPKAAAPPEEPALETARKSPSGLLDERARDLKILLVGRRAVDELKAAPGCT